MDPRRCHEEKKCVLNLIICALDFKISIDYLIHAIDCFWNDIYHFNARCLTAQTKLPSIYTVYCIHTHIQSTAVYLSVWW